MSEFIIFVLVVFLLTIFSVAIINLKNKNLELVMALEKVILEMQILSNQNKDDSFVEKEHLISFLSDTRNAAYQYIEDMHQALLEFKSEIEFDLLNPSEMSIPRIKKSFEKLEKIYPEDIPND
jgi:c-di-AMP phosphodiesterase-like protein